MFVYYRILEDYNLLVLKWTGTWSLDDYNKTLDAFMELMKSRRFKSVVSDLRELSGSMKKSDLDLIIPHKPRFTDHLYRTVYLIDNPAITAYIHLYSEKFNSSEPAYQYCITTRKACTLLGIAISQNDLDLALEQADQLL